MMSSFRLLALADSTEEAVVGRSPVEEEAVPSEAVEEASDG